MRRKYNFWTHSALYLADEMNEEQEKDFCRWLENDLSRKNEFEIMKNTWKNFEPDPANKRFDSEKAWGSLRNRLEQDGLVSEHEQSRRRIPVYFLRIAAGILIILCIGIPVLYLSPTGKKQPSDLIEYAAKEGSSTLKLPEGTLVFLNEGSKIRYAEDYPVNRSVILSGEAYFVVIPDSTSPFKVNLNTSVVTVLGTSFNVKENSAEKKVEVLVESGEVLLQVNAKEHGITLLPGQFGECDGKVSGYSSQNDLNYLSWKTKEFKFVDTAMDEIIKTLENAYHVKIISDTAALSNKRLTSMYSQQSLDVILETICTALNLNYSKNGKEYRISNN